ncbi:TOMM precursor leader peptide-binding protein [Paenibacillus pasadenensis]|uniref:TOMM leader peptide-binding protein n=1 Tax=Paenibacillus pasadenensis TaxID=217090 RepID=A0A2N5N0H0_9BACL|nr:MULTISPECIES: TOMM precursor leader peptide-binding protein [Paenibacillus]PLT43830.1 hypothetical protein B8V81_2261 [Paenibacillus pasadenensis]QGG54428.1 TOMM precursor leader peptide-binding protein [Paenibacillus sp. B01]
MNAFVTLLGGWGESGEAEPIAAALRGLGVEARAASAFGEIDPGSDLVLVLQAERQGAAFNAYALEHGLTWLPVAFSHTVGRLGPIVVPGETACYECLELRGRANGVPPLAPKPSRFDPSWSMVASLAVMETVKWLSRSTNSFAPLSLGHQVEFDAFHLQGEVNPVYRLPTCPSCGLRHQARLAAQPWTEAGLVHRP